jgi:hypothetical protein
LEAFNQYIPVMKTFYTFLLLMLVNLVHGQFAIIDDKDGNCNVRSTAESGNNITDKLENGHFVFCLETKGNWVNIDYSINNQDFNGYVYNSRLKMINAYEGITIISKSDDVSMYGKDSIKVTVRKQKFDKSKYRFSYYKDSKDQIELINGKPFWGSDGGEPAFAYKSITITKGNKIIELPKAAIEDLFQPTLYHTKVNYDRDNDILYIQSMNSDGAGGYLVIWKIEKGTYKCRYVAHGF